MYRFYLENKRKNYPQIYLGQCKCKIRRKKLVDFIDAEVNLSSDDSDDSAKWGTFLNL